MLWTPTVVLYNGSEKVLTEWEALKRRPDDRIVLQVANAAVENGKPDVAMDVITQMERNGTPMSVFIMSVLIKAHGRLCDAEGVTRVLAEMNRRNLTPDLVLFNAAIDAYVRCGEIGTARAMLRQILMRRLKPNSRSFNPLLRSLARAGKVEEIMVLRREMEKRGVRASGHTINAIIKGLVMNGEWDKALSLLKDLDGVKTGKRDLTVGYTIVVSALAEKGYVDSALEILETLINEGGTIEVEEEIGKAYAALLTVMLKKTEIVRAWKLFREVRHKFRIRLPVEVYGTMIRGLAKRGDKVSVQAAGRVFEEMMVVFKKKVNREKQVLRRGKVCDGIGDASVKDVAIAYNSMIDGFVRCGDTFSGEKLLNEMEDLGHIPTAGIYTTLISGYGKESDIISVKRIFWRMRKAGIRPDRVAMNALMGACVRVGDLDLTVRFFEEMQQHGGPISPDLVTFSALIAGYLRKDMTSEAWDAYEEMKGMGIVPNERLLERMMVAFVSPTLKPSRREVWESSEAEEITLTSCSDRDFANSEKAHSADKTSFGEKTDAEVESLESEADLEWECVDLEVEASSGVEDLRDTLTVDDGWASKRVTVLLKDMENCKCSEINKRRWRRAILSIWA